MNQPGDSEPEYVLARRALLDALDALKDHLDALILVGAQAIYLHAGEADVAISPRTDDGDLLVDPAILAEDPLLEEVMSEAGFELNLERRNPGEWISRDGIHVDLLVPMALGGAGRRGARIPPHSKEAARKVVGLEAATVDNEPMVIASFDDHQDDQRFEIAVAGPTALLIAKLHKIADRKSAGDRLLDKDAHDIYRLMRVVPTATFVTTLSRLRVHAVARETTETGTMFLQELFGSEDALGSVMAGRAEGILGDANVTAARAASLALDILEALP